MQHNDAKPHWVIEKINTAAEHFKSLIVALMGLAFKVDIDDLRASPALQIADAGGTTLVVEPNVSELPASLAAKAELVDVNQCRAQADIVAILVDHKEFSSLDMTRLASKVVIDTQGVLFRD